MEKIFESYELFVETLTPVHIGCGEEYVPSNYVIDNKKLCYFNITDLIDVDLDLINELTKLSANEDHASILEYAKLFQKHVKTIKDKSQFKIDVISDIEKKYKEELEKLDAQSLKNQLLIDRHVSNSVNGNAIIPGSSIKGAIRTAILEHIRRKKNQYFNADDAQYENKILDYSKQVQDRMKMFKISDAYFAADKKKIIYAVNCKKAKKTASLPLWTEVLNKGSTTTANINLFNRINIESKVSDELAKTDDYFVNSHILDEILCSFDNLREVCNNFYIPILEKELTNCENKGYFSKQYCQDMKKKLQDIQAKKDTLLIRIGRFVGAESITLGCREIEINVKKDENSKAEFQKAKESTSYWLACDSKPAVSDNNFQPFGWVRLRTKTNTDNTNNLDDGSFIEINQNDIDRYKDKFKHINKIIIKLNGLSCTLDSSNSYIVNSCRELMVILQSNNIITDTWKDKPQGIVQFTSPEALAYVKGLLS